MMPDSLIDIELEVSEDVGASKTYRLKDNKLQGYTDKIAALQQAIYKILSTEKYEYPIYSFSYGIELENLIGKDPTYTRIELQRRIQECLLQDERIASVDSFTFAISGDELLCVFNVVSIYGEITISKEVNI